MGSTVDTSQLNRLPALPECHLLCHMLPAISSLTSAPAFAEDATFLGLLSGKLFLAEEG